jgi:serine/threonine protein kinase/Tol biopolymer transport system component
MTITAGTKLGRYEIRSKVGEGGMGEVYAGRDTQLGRDVAVKVLPTTVSTDPDRLRRFEQEACAASALNHPNILVVHDIGAHDGTTYVVSELLEGETLRKRIGGTPLGQRRAVDYALQIANGLAAAHEKGIIHRDLKPDNVFVTNDGRVKILDFGLAKLTQLDGNQVQTDVPTRRVNTDSGVVMGTVGYMSPEQLKGRPVDQRSDIFAFGAILYEMLSGRRAFHGESAAETMSAILKEDPPELSDTNKTVSPALERLVNHCLEKNSEARFHSARDVAFALEALSGSSVASETTTPQSFVNTTSRVRQWLPWALAAMGLLIAAITLAWTYFRREQTDARPIEALRFTIPIPEKAQTFGPPTISPNGRYVVFRVNTDDGKELLWMHALGSFEGRPLVGTDGGFQPFWSSDSRAVGFFAKGKLKWIDVSGGSVQTVCDAPSNYSGAWSRDGTIIFSKGFASGLYRVPATGGTPLQLTTVDASRNEIEHLWPYFLPDGRHFLFLARNTQPENSAIYVGSLDSKETTRLLQAHSSMAYASPGYLLFGRERTLMAQGFDADTLQLKGEAFPVAERTVLNSISGRAAFSVSESGVLVFRAGAGILNNQLVWLDRSGKQLRVLTPPASYNAPALSPDEKKVAISRPDLQTGALNDIWLIDLERGSQIRLTTDPASDSLPSWSPNGDHVTFVSTRNGVTSIYQKLSNGASPEEPLVSSAEVKFNPQWAPDGQSIIYSQLNPKTNVDLYLLSLSGEKKPMSWLQTSFIEAQPRLSPNGRWIAYISNETEQFQVYVDSFPVPGAKVAISIGGGSQPQWRADGRELYYYAPDQKLVAVEVNGDGPTFKVGEARPLFEIRVASVDQRFPGNGYYTVTKDGKRFLVVSLPEAPERQQINVILNWTADIKK